MSVVWFAKVSEKGLVVIPKELREKYGIKKGDKVSFVDYGGTIYLMPVPEDPIRSSLGMFKGLMTMEDYLEDKRKERELEEEKMERWMKKSGEDA
jgi:AbrB family looped-hinge helix DNA binding protein